ncbi:hypothetical protein KUTeg_020478 [Tegillarca granosa]|uniref:C2H2-type domain-containing protein n=1 Tax=Tegillarca granosa TaxID=220873 RepID=A0ABQ9E801_TEGGR|nr:hypothetical protein KUTeg_020478 [Tegillarca granosa]
MDFSALVAELRNIANKYHGRDTDANVSTAMYCEMFRKILQKANMGTTSYSDQIVILWMTLSQLRNTAEALSACSARDSLYQHIFLLCAKTVLNIKWQQLEDEDLKSKQNLRATVEATHSQLQLAGFDRFGLLLPLMDDPWTDPILSQIMAGEDTESNEAKEYINKEDSLILKLRVEMLIQESCEEFALNLCECCLEHDKFKDDLELTQKQLFLLFKLNNTDRLQEVCEKIPCHTGIKIILKMEQKESNQAICVRLIQTFLVQDWVNPDRNCCTNELLKLWIRHQYLTDKNKEKFLESVWAIAKLSSNTNQICVLVTGLQKECGFSLLQLYTDLLVFAINFDKGQCEQEMLKGHMEGVKKHQLAISNTCKKLTELYEVVNPKIAKVGILTAFALNATGQSLLAVKKIFCDSLNEGRKHGPGLCPVDCISPECRRKKFMYGKTDRKSKEELYNDSVNPATLYEVERLLNMLRPYYLNPELSWQKLQSVCFKFLAEKGLSGHDKQKEQTVIKEGFVTTESLQTSDNSKSILSKCCVTDQTKTAGVQSSKIQIQEMASCSAVSPSILRSTAPLIKSKTSTSASNPQIFNSYQNMFRSSLSTPTASSPSVVRQSASSSNLHQQQRTANQQSVAELLAQTAVPYSTLKNSKVPVSPLSADLAHLEKQIKISTLLAETAAQKSAKSNKQSGQTSGSNISVSKVSEADRRKQQLKTTVSATSSVFNLISLEDIKKQLRDAQVANAHKIVKIPVTMQSGFIVQQPPQLVTYRPPNPTSVKSQPRQRRPRILSNASRVSNQQQLIHTDLNLIQKQGNAINRAMQVNQSVSKAMQVSQSAAKLMQINQLATTVQPSKNLLNQSVTNGQPNQNLLNQSSVQISQSLLQTVTTPSIQAGIINQGLTVLHAKPLDSDVGASLSNIKPVSQTVNQSNKSAAIRDQSIQTSTVDSGVETSSAFYVGNIIQTPVQIASMQNVNTASGVDVFNLVPQSVTIDTSNLSGLSKVSTQVFNITPSATASEKLSNIKPPSATISMNKGTTDWSNVKPPSSSLNVTYNSQLKTINATGSLSGSFLTTSAVSFPPYQRQASGNSINIAGNTVSSSSEIISASTSTSKTSNVVAETLPSDVVNLLVQENQKHDSISNKTAKLQLAMKAAERRPSADELKSIVDWLQTGTEDAVNKPVITMASSVVNKTMIAKSNIKSPFENVKTKLVLTPPQTTLTIQNLSSLQFVDSTATSKPGNTQLTTVHCTQGNKPLILSTKSQNQFATNFLGTVVNTGKQSTIGSDQNSTATNVSVTMTTTSNTSTVSSSNDVTSTNTNNVASTVLFPFTSFSSASPSNITFLDSSKLKAENITQLLYLGQIKSGALNVQAKSTMGSGSGQQQWPEIGAVMSSAKQIVRELYAKQTATTTVSQSEAVASNSSDSTNTQGPSTVFQGSSANIQGPSRNISGLSNDIQGLPSTVQELSNTVQGPSSNIQGLILASSNFAESSNSSSNKEQTISTSPSSQVVNKHLISELNTGLDSKGKGTLERQKNNSDNDTNRELLTKVIENELKQIIVQADISVVNETDEQNLGKSSTEIAACGLQVNRLTTSTDLDITESDKGRKDDSNRNNEFGKSVAEEKGLSVSNNIIENCPVDDKSAEDKITSNELVVLREEVVEEIVDIETTHDIDIPQRGLILSDSEVLSNKLEKNIKINNSQDELENCNTNLNKKLSDPNLAENAENLHKVTKDGLHNEHSNLLGKSEDNFAFESDLSHHTKHTNIDKAAIDDSLQCLICKKTFLSVGSLKDHVRDICKPTLTSESQFYCCIYYCSNCSYRSESKAYMALHIKDCENTVYTEHNIKLPNIYKRFCCRMCGQICLTKENVLEHISSDCRHRIGQGENRVDSSATTLKLASNDEGISSDLKHSDSKGIKVMSESTAETLDNDNNTSVLADEDNVTVDVDGETTDELQSDNEVDETTKNRRKKWFLRNKESRSYEELDENMAKIEEELSNQGTVESKLLEKQDIETKEGEITLVKRRRGRPRIYKISDQNVKKVLIKKTINENTQGGTVVKRKRGRPRIYKLPEEITPEDLATNNESLPQKTNDETEDEMKTEDKLSIHKGKNVLKRKIKNDFPICRGKRIIKVAKLFSDYELPDFVKAQAEKCNVKRLFYSQKRIFTQRLKNVFTDREKKNLCREKSPHKMSIRTKTTKCIKCGQVFRDHNVMLQHVASVHLSPYKSTWNKKKKKFCFLCRYCPNYFNTYIKFLDHVTIHSEKLLKQLEGKNFKGKKDMVNLKKLARQEQIASLSAQISQEFDEKAGEIETLSEVNNSKEKLSRSSRASSVSSCDTDSSRKKRTRSRLKLRFSENNISEESDKDSNNTHTSTLITRHNMYSCQVNETTEDEKHTEDGSKLKSVVSDEIESNHNDEAVIHNENAECMKTENKEFVERIISTRGKIYKIKKSPENSRNVDCVKKHLKEEEIEKVSETSTSEEDQSSSTKNNLRKNETTDIDKTILSKSETTYSDKTIFSKDEATGSDSKIIYSQNETLDIDDNTILNKNETSDSRKINFKRSISTRKKTYIYDGNESSSGNKDSNFVPGNAQTECNVEILEKEKNLMGNLKLNNSKSESCRVEPENSDNTKQNENSDEVTSERRTRNKCYILKDLDTTLPKDLENEEFTKIDTVVLKENVTDDDKESSNNDTRPSRHTRSRDKNDYKPYTAQRNISERKTKKDICYLDLSRNGRKERDGSDSRESAGSGLDKNTRNREQTLRKSEEYISSRKSRSRTNSGTSHSSDHLDDKPKTGDLKKTLNMEDFEMKRKRESKQRYDSSYECKKPKIEKEDPLDMKSKCSESEGSKGLNQEKPGGTLDGGRVSTRSGLSQTKSKSNTDTKMNTFSVSPVKTRSRSSLGYDKNNFQHGNLTPSKDSTRKLETTSQGALQKCFKDLQKKQKECKDKYLNAIAARKSNLRSSFSSKLGRGSIFGIRAQRLMSRNEKKENSLKKLMSSKKRATSREIISKTSVSCNIKTISGKVETANDKYVTEKPTTRNTSINKRLSTDEELLAAAGCLESSRRLRVNLDRNVTELLNKDKKLTCIKLENEKEIKNNENKDVDDESQNTNNSINTIILGQDCECEKSTAVKLQDRNRKERIDVHVDSDKLIDKDNEISECEEFENESDENKEEEVFEINRNKHKIKINKHEEGKQHKIQEMKNEEKEQQICGSIDDEEFAFVKTPVLLDNSQKQTKEGINTKNRTHTDNKAAFIESFKSYIDTARNKNLSVVSKIRSRQRGKSSEFTVHPQEKEISSEDMAEDHKNKSQKLDSSNTECSSAFLNSFKMYIDKNRDNKDVTPNRVDLEKKIILENKAESKVQTDKKRSKSEGNSKTCNDDDKVKERRNSEGPGGSKQLENIKILTVSPVSDYLKNFKAYISQRSEKTNKDTGDKNKIYPQNLNREVDSKKIVKSDNKKSTCSKDDFSVQSDSDNYKSLLGLSGSISHSEALTVPSLGNNIHQNSESSVSIGNMQTNSGSNSSVGTSIQSNTSVNKPGHSSFLDSFLAHCGKGNKSSDNNFICESPKYIQGEDERKENNQEDQINKEEKLEDIQTKFDKDKKDKNIKDKSDDDIQTKSMVYTATPIIEQTESSENEQSCLETSIPVSDMEMFENEGETLTEEKHIDTVVNDIEIYKDEREKLEISKGEGENLKFSKDERQSLEISKDDGQILEIFDNEEEIFEISNKVGKNLKVDLEKEQNVKITEAKGKTLEMLKYVEEKMEISNSKGENLVMLNEKEQSVDCAKEIISNGGNEDMNLTLRHYPRTISKQYEKTVNKDTNVNKNQKIISEGEVTLALQSTSELTLTGVESFQKNIISSLVTECIEKDSSQSSSKGQVEEDLSWSSCKGPVEGDSSLSSCKGGVEEDSIQCSYKGEVEEDSKWSSCKDQVEEDSSLCKGQVEEDSSQSSCQDNVDYICQQIDKGKTNSTKLNLENKCYTEQCSETSSLKNKNREKSVILDMENGNYSELHTRSGTLNIGNELHCQQENCSTISNKGNNSSNKIEEESFEISNRENIYNNKLHKSCGTLIIEDVSTVDNENDSNLENKDVSTVDNENDSDLENKDVSTVDNENDSDLENKCTSDMQVRSTCVVTLSTNEHRNKQQTSETPNIENEYNGHLQQKSMVLNIESKKSREVNKSSVVNEQDSKMYESSLTLEMDYLQDDQKQAEKLHICSKQIKEENEICSEHKIKEDDKNKMLQSDAKTLITSSSEQVTQFQMAENTESISKSKVILETQDENSSHQISTQPSDVNKQVSVKSDPIDNPLQSTKGAIKIVSEQTMDNTESSHEISLQLDDENKQNTEKSCSSECDFNDTMETPQKEDETNSVNKVIMEPDLSFKPFVIETMNKADVSVKQVARETINKADLSVKQVTMTPSKTMETSAKTGASKSIVKLTESYITRFCTVSTATIDTPENVTNDMTEKKKPILKSVSCQSGPATLKNYLYKHVLCKTISSVMNVV